MQHQRQVMLRMIQLHSRYSPMQRHCLWPAGTSPPHTRYSPTRHRCLDPARTSPPRTQCSQPHSNYLYAPSISQPRNRCSQMQRHCQIVPRTSQLHSRCSQMQHGCLYAPSTFQRHTQCSQTRHHCQIPPPYTCQPHSRCSRMQRHCQIALRTSQLHTQCSQMRLYCQPCSHTSLSDTMCNRPHLPAPYTSHPGKIHTSWLDCCHDQPAQPRRQHRPEPQPQRKCHQDIVCRMMLPGTRSVQARTGDKESQHRNPYQHTQRNTPCNS